MWTVSPTRLEDTCAGLLRAAGASAHDARLVAAHLVDNDVIGHRSHGVLRLWDYIEAVRRGDLIPDARPRIVNETSTTAQVDGNWALGQVVATFATDLAIGKARTAGVSVVTVRRANHIGRLGRYAEQVADAGLVAMVFANGGGHGINQAPFRGTERKLCSNPLAISVPSSLVGPFLLDMATSVVAEGKVRMRRWQGRSTPSGWIIDSDGNPSTDPEDFATGGALLPVGRDEGHKGYALAFMVELLGGVLSGGGTSSEPGRSFSNDSMIVVLDPERFVPLPELKARSRSLTEHLKDTRLADQSQPVLYPGEKEAEARSANRDRDIELPEPVREQFRSMLRRYSLPEAELSPSPEKG